MNDGKYTDVNGLHLYYVTHGPQDSKGPPLVLLHGGLGAVEMMMPLTLELSRDRQVIVPDLQAHGRTADIDRPMRFESLADDVAALLQHLNIKQVDVLGYSMGGGVALRTAIQHPELVRKLLVVSFPFKSGGFFPDIVAQQKQLGPQAAKGMKGSPPHQLYMQVAPNPADWPKLVARMGELMGHEFDWTAKVKNLQAQVQLVSGDADMLPPGHLAEFFALLGGGQKDGGGDRSGITCHRLAILPATTHYDILEASLLLPILRGFLEAL